MNTQPNRITLAVKRVWKHGSALVALVLIVLALWIGLEIGGASSAPPPTPALEAPSQDASAEPTPMYTCSMHPSVRLSDPSAKCPICFMDLIPIETGDGQEQVLPALTLSEDARIRAGVETSVVTRAYPRAEVRLYGKLGYDETSVARLSAYFPGRIDRLFVNYVGIPVQKGDHIAELYSPELLASFEELRQASKSARVSSDSSAFLRQTAEQTLTASREKLRLLGIHKQQIEQIESGAFDADELTIYSPIGGVVTHLAAREGDYLNTGDPIATVADLSRLWLDLEAYESQLPLLRWGLGVTFTVESHPGEVFQGKVSFIEPMIDDQTRTASVRVAVDNRDRLLKPGMFATAMAHPRITAMGAVMGEDFDGKWVCPMHPDVVSEAPGSCAICGMDMIPAETLGIAGRDSQDDAMPLVIPKSAVLFTGKRSLVYVQRADSESSMYEPRTVVLGPRAGEMYTVRSGLEAGERVVVSGAFRIDSAMQIQGKPNMMSPEGDRNAGPGMEHLEHGHD